MYYLTYRPRTISELDNTAVRERLNTLLQRGEIPHALLLVGHKGMGKTSTARIIAKALNCIHSTLSGNKNAKGFEPCNKCVNCTRIDANSSPDVTEQDAASNRGIDDIRKLIMESGFAPMTGTYRVYIIDEAHMITTEGFNALLKTLEEPPSHTVFILATTNEEKVPATIASRCVVVRFGHAEEKDIIHMLSRIVEIEKLKLEDGVMKMIVNACDRSFRDAAKLLEELALHDKLSVANAAKYLGTSSVETFLHLLQQGDTKKIFEWIQVQSTEGMRPQIILERILKELRGSFVSLCISEQGTPKYSFTKEQTLRLLKIFHEAYRLQRITPVEILPLEMGVAEYLQIRDNATKK